MSAAALNLEPLASQLTQYSQSINAAGPNNEGSAVEFDLLHQIIDAIQTMSRPSLQALGKQLQDAMLAAMQQGPTAPFRRLIANVLRAYFTYGDGRPPYSIVTSTQQWLNSKPASTPHPNGRACGILVLGTMTEMSGRQLLSLLEETVTVIGKYLKTDYPAGVRQACMKALRDVIEGSGKQGAHLHLEIMKLIKTAHTDKAAEVREASAACVLALARLGVARERLVNVCLKGLEDGAAGVRAAFAEALGAMLARALLAPDKKMDDDDDDAAAAGAGGGEATAEEAAACTGALARLLRPEGALGPAVTPAMLAELLRVALCAARLAATSAAVEGAAAELALAVAQQAPREPYFAGAEAAPGALHALFELAALPLHRHLPAAPASPAEAATLTPAQSASAAAALAALAALATRLLAPALAAGPRGPLAAYAPAALLLLSRTLARCPPELAPEALKALRAAAGAGGPLLGKGPDGAEAARWWLELLAATASALLAALEAVGLEAPGAAQRRQALLSGLATLLPALPVEAAPACRAAHSAAVGALRAALASGSAQVAGQAVAAARAIVASPAADLARAYAAALGPHLAACLLRPAASEAAAAAGLATGLPPWEGPVDAAVAVRLEAGRLLLHAVTLSPEDARPGLVAALVPAVVGALQGPPALQQGALQLLTQLGSAAPDAFRSAAAALAPEARRCMEEAVRASVAQPAAPQAAQAAPATRSGPAAPRIQLRTDFSNFGKR